jgi:hypothetical protein
MGSENQITNIVNDILVSILKNLYSYNRKIINMTLYIISTLALFLYFSESRGNRGGI